VKVTSSRVHKRGWAVTTGSLPANANTSTLLPDVTAKTAPLVSADVVVLGCALGAALGDVLGDRLGETLGDRLGDVLGDVLGDALGDAFGVDDGC